MATIAATHSNDQVSNVERQTFLSSFDRKGFSIERVSNIVLPILYAAVAIATSLGVGASIALPLGVSVLVISSIGYAALISGTILFGFAFCWPEKMQRVLDKIRATALDVLAHIALALMYPFCQARLDPKKSEQIDPNQTPILLVHGYLHNSSGWGYFRYRLKLAGHKNVFTIDLGDPFLSIETYAEKVKQKTEEIKKLTGRSDLHLIGHSMGGVVGSYYAMHLAPEGSVKSIQTLGSPLQGTSRKGVGMPALQMRHKSEFIEELRGRIKKSSVPFNHIGSHADLVVMPHDSMYLKQNPYILYPDLGHVSYLFADRVIRNCVLFLKKY